MVNEEIETITLSLTKPPEGIYECTTRKRAAADSNEEVAVWFALIRSDQSLH